MARRGKKQTITSADVGTIPVDDGTREFADGEPRIVAAVASSSGHGATGAQSNRARRIQDSHTRAVEECLAEGVDINSDEGTAAILERKAANRLAVIAEMEAEDAAAAVVLEAAAAQRQADAEAARAS